jgi:hypothetical protein
VSATPFLDLERTLPQPSRSRLQKLIGIAIGLVIAAIIIAGDQHQLPGWNWPAFNGLLFFPELYAVIAFHEAGHLLTGLMVGLDAGGISVGPLSLIKSGRNWAFRFERRNWMGGFFKPLLRTADLDAAPYGWMIAGGPLASLILTVTCAVIGVRFGNGTWDWIGSLFWMSLFTLLISALPFSSGLNKSDGARLWQLIRYPERTRAWSGLIAIQTEDASGLRPRDWDSEIFEHLLAVEPTAGEYVNCQYLAYYWRLDQGCEDEALKHLENVLGQSDRAGAPFRHVVFLEAGMRQRNHLKNRPRTPARGVIARAKYKSRTYSMLLKAGSRCVKDAFRKPPYIGKPRGHE